MTIPKNYSYTVDGVVDADNESIIFSVPSFNLSLIHI